MRWKTTGETKEDADGGDALMISDARRAGFHVDRIRYRQFATSEIIVKTNSARLSAVRSVVSSTSYLTGNKGKCVER